METHEIREVCFENETKTVSVGEFPAIDYIGDGSFFLLDAPGHTIGHLASLARVTLGSSSSDEHKRDKFVFLGGEICHYPGVFRPTERLSLNTEARLLCTPARHRSSSIFTLRRAPRSHIIR